MLIHDLGLPIGERLVQRAVAVPLAGDTFQIVLIDSKHR